MKHLELCELEPVDTSSTIYKVDLFRFSKHISCQILNLLLVVEEIKEIRGGHESHIVSMMQFANCRSARG